MKKLFMVVLYLFVLTSISFTAPQETMIYKGELMDGGKVLVSSYGVVRSGQSAWSYTDAVLSDTTYDKSTNFDFIIDIEGYSVWIDSHADISTSGATEGYRIKSGQWRSLGGVCYDKFYARTLDASANIATIYFWITGDEIRAK